MNKEEKETLPETPEEAVEDRSKQYGSPQYNLGCSGELAEVVLRYLNQREAEGMLRMPPDAVGALLGVLLKMGRMITSPVPRKDTLVDLQAYAALFADAMERSYSENR